jgi:iron complex transport system ATP-binding protein
VSAERVNTEHRYRDFDVQVVAVRRLSPNFVRITFGGTALANFASDGLDQRIKVLLPNSQGGVPAFAVGPVGWRAQWAALPDELRPPMRSYTIRDLRPGRDGRVEVDVDFVLHGDDGAASRWASHATAGARIVLIGPNAQYPGQRGGIGWIPPHGAQRLLIAGDETALPAIGLILASLPADADVRAFIEVPVAEDSLALPPAERRRVTWLPRDSSNAAPGTLLVQAVRGALPAARNGFGAEPVDVDVDSAVLWEVPNSDPVTAEPAAETAFGDSYVWLAGEAGAISQLRRHLVRDVGLVRTSVAFMGYSRLGKPQA